MVEWLLVFTVNLAGTAGDLRNVSAGNVGGFQSKQTCRDAGMQITEAYVKLMQQSGLRRVAPGNSVFFECLEIRK
jgi:hypothetical protein